MTIHQIYENIDIKHFINTNNIIDSNLNIIYMNIRSLRNKLEHLETLLHTHRLIHIVILTETWLHENETHLYNLQNYKHIFNTRPTRGGGVSIFVHNSLNANVLYNEEWELNNILGIQLLNQSMKINLFAVYRHILSNFTNFLFKINQILQKYKRSILMGDFNLNLLEQNNNEIKQYVDTINCEGFMFLNKISPQYTTRINNETNNHSIIDHIITDMITYTYSMTLYDTHLSDHRYILTTIKDFNTRSNLHIPPTNTFKIIEYHKVTPIDLSNIISSNNIDTLITKIQNTLNQHTIIKIKPSKSFQKIKKPWMTNTILQTLKHPKQLFQIEKTISK